MLICLHYGSHPHTFIHHLVCHVAHTWLGGTISSTIYPWRCYHLVDYPLSPCPYTGDDWVFASEFCGNLGNCATSWYRTCSTSISTVSMDHWGHPLVYATRSDGCGLLLPLSWFVPVVGDESRPGHWFDPVVKAGSGPGFVVLGTRRCPLVL